MVTDQIYDTLNKRFRDKRPTDFRRSYEKTIYAVGTTVERAIKALASDGRGWKNIKDITFEPVDSPCEWYVRFWANGTSMKAGGQYVNGGVILTWWK